MRRRARFQAFHCFHRGWLPLLAVSACAGGLLACGGPASDEPESSGSRPVAVEVVRIGPESLRDVVDIPGQLESGQSVEIRSEVEGILGVVGFTEGQRVAEGDLLFQLRDERERAVLSEAQASLKLAGAVYRRTKDLAGRNVSSAAALERAEGERSVAQARVELAQVEVERKRILAPFDGVMGSLRVHPGDQVRKRTPLSRIDHTERLQLVFYLPETAVGAVSAGAPVRIKVAPHPGEYFDGEVFFVSPTLDPNARRIEIKANVPNADGRLLPGLFAEVEAEIARRDDALLVPESALVYGLEGTHVWRVDGEQRVARAPVEVGLRSDGRVEVVAGLEPGDAVVAAGIHKVKEGDRVSSVSPAPAAEELRAADGPAEPAGRDES